MNTKFEKLRKTCRLLELDIQETTNEIIELELSRENLIKELKNSRRKLYIEIAKLMESSSTEEIPINKRKVNSTTDETNQRRKSL